MNNIIRINKSDNVAVALVNLKKNNIYTYDNVQIKVLEDIAAGHKIAIKNINSGEKIIKYGNPIGTAIDDIKAGDHVHIHNIRTNLSDILDYRYNPINIKQEKTYKLSKKTFNGYKRENGKVGIRNQIWILPTVGCVNSIVNKIAEKSQCFVRGNIEDIIAFNHPYGCSQMGEDQENTRKILADLSDNPNAGAVLIVGLGCENCGINTIKKYMGEINPNRIKFMSCQDYEDEIVEGVNLIKQLSEYADNFERSECNIDNLIIGLKCGGSDGLSGITANPAVGAFSDCIITNGGTTILTEVPEMFGAETLLMNRCKDKKTFEKTVKLINDFKNYYKENHQAVYENPSPGNKSGGISTLEDKSLGCIQKSGSLPVSDVLSYGDIVKQKGLNLLSAPGNDLVAATALAASGAQIIIFTTGRGTPFGSPVPTIKISSNSEIFTRKKNWIDFNTGDIISGKSIEEKSMELYNFVIETANGKKLCSEINGYHDMAIFKKGVIL